MFSRLVVVHNFLLIKQQIENFNFKLITFLYFVIRNSKTKYIDIRHHLLCDHISKCDICFEFVDTKKKIC